MGAKDGVKKSSAFNKMKSLRSKSADPRANAPVKKVSAASSRIHNAKSMPVIGKENGDVDGKKKKKKKKKKGGEEEEEENPGSPIIPQPPPPKITLVKEDKRKKTLWRHMILLILLFAYSLFGGVIFSAIEGGNEKVLLLQRYESNTELYNRRKIYQQQVIKRFDDIDRDTASIEERKGVSRAKIKHKLMQDALLWYERKVGMDMEPPIMGESKWNLWGGVYYAASLYTTIGYGNFHPLTTAGRIVSMMYAVVGIPLVFTILLEWGYLYFTWIEYGWNRLSEILCQKSLQREVDKRIQRERFRRVGSEMSLGSMSAMPLLSIHRGEGVNTTDHQIESNRPLRELDVTLSESEQAKTVPMKAALLFFLLWISLSAFIVRLWEYEWTYFSAWYFFFTSLTTIGLGDVVTKTPNFIIFNLAMTLIGLSVVGLCVAIVQIRLVFDRMMRSIDSQYRIRQIDADVATMTVCPDENEGVKRLVEAQPLEDRIVYVAMDEHKKSMLTERWKTRSGMSNRITQTYPQKSDKFTQTGQRVYDQPRLDGEWSSSEEEGEEEEESEGEYDEKGNKLVPVNSKRYIYTVYD